MIVAVVHAADVVGQLGNKFVVSLDLRKYFLRLLFQFLKGFVFLALTFKLAIMPIDISLGLNQLPGYCLHACFALDVLKQLVP